MSFAYGFRGRAFTRRVLHLVTYGRFVDAFTVPVHVCGGIGKAPCFCMTPPPLNYVRYIASTHAFLASMYISRVFCIRKRVWETTL